MLLLLLRCCASCSAACCVPQPASERTLAHRHPCPLPPPSAFTPQGDGGGVGQGDWRGGGRGVRQVRAGAARARGPGLKGLCVPGELEWRGGRAGGHAAAMLWPCRACLLPPPSHPLLTASPASPTCPPPTLLVPPPAEVWLRRVRRQRPARAARPLVCRAPGGRRVPGQKGGPRSARARPCLCGLCMPPRLPSAVPRRFTSLPSLPPSPPCRSSPPSTTSTLASDLGPIEPNSGPIEAAGAACRAGPSPH